MRFVSPRAREIYPDPKMNTISALCWMEPKLRGTLLAHIDSSLEILSVFHVQLLKLVRPI